VVTVPPAAICDRHHRACPGDPRPRLADRDRSLGSWMAGPSPAMTNIIDRNNNPSRLPHDFKSATSGTSPAVQQIRGPSPRAKGPPGGDENVELRVAGCAGLLSPPSRMSLSVGPYELVDAALLGQAGVDIAARVDADAVDVAAFELGKHGPVGRTDGAVGRV